MDWLSWLYFFICAVHALYAINFLVGVKLIVSPDDHYEPVTVIVAARNEADNLQKLIPLLLNQEFKEFQVIIALNKTDDHSHEVLSGYNDPRLDFIDIKDVPDTYHPKKYAITQAIQRARHDALLFTDADCRPHPQWIGEMIKGFHRDIVLGYAPYQRTSGLISELTTFETRTTALFYSSRAGLDRAYMGVGRNLGYRKSLFIQYGGFKKIAGVVGGDDDLMINEMAKDSLVAVQLSKNSQVASAPENSWKDYVEQKTRHLHSGKHYRLKDKIFLAGFSLTHIGLILGLANFFYNPYTILQFIVAYFPLLLAYSAFGNKTGDRSPWPKILLLDVLYVFFHIFVGIRALGTKRIEWTN